MASNFDAFHFRIQSYKKILIFANEKDILSPIPPKKLCFSLLLYPIHPSGVAARAGNDVSQGGGLVGVEAESRG